MCQHWWNVNRVRMLSVVKIFAEPRIGAMSEFIIEN